MHERFKIFEMNDNVGSWLALSPTRRSFQVLNHLWSLAFSVWSFHVLPVFVWGLLVQSIDMHLGKRRIVKSTFLNKSVNCCLPLYIRAAMGWPGNLSRCTLSVVWTEKLCVMQSHPLLSASTGSPFKNPLLFSQFYMCRIKWDAQSDACWWKTNNNPLVYIHASHVWQSDHEAQIQGRMTRKNIILT